MSCPAKTRSGSQGPKASSNTAHKDEQLDDLTKCNEWFHGVYSSTHQTLTRTVSDDHPVILVLGTRMIFLHKQNREDVEFSPPVFDWLKISSHVPLALSLIVQPFMYTHIKNGKGSDIDNNAKNQLKELLIHINKITPQLSLYFPDAKMRTRQEFIFDQTEKMARSLLEMGHMNTEEIKTYISHVRKCIDENISDATKLHLLSMHKQVMKFRQHTKSEEWNGLRVAVAGSPVPRGKEMHMMYFQELLGVTPGKNGRLVYAENITDEDKMLDLLGSHSTDEEIGITFWGNAQRMHSDVMAKDCDKYLMDIFPGKRWKARQKTIKSFMSVFIIAGVIMSLLVYSLFNLKEIVSLPQIVT